MANKTGCMSPMYWDIVLAQKSAVALIDHNRGSLNTCYLKATSSKDAMLWNFIYVL